MQIGSLKMVTDVMAHPLSLPRLSLGAYCDAVVYKNDHFTKTGSGQT